MAAANVPDGKYYIMNVVTNRRILTPGTIVENHGDEKGYADAPKIVGADKDYENRATWQVIHKSDGKYFLENVKTLRYVLQDGKPLSKNPDDMGSWENAPNTKGADENYYYRAYWRFVPQGNGTYLIKNDFTGRYLFQTGDPVIEDERGYEDAPETLGTDGNYDNRAFWKLDLKKD